MTSPRRVLVVEDESAQRVMYSKALAHMDFEPVCVGSMEAAKSALAAKPFAIALLDLNLGVSHGMDLFEDIRDRFPAVSVVIATGYGTFDIARKSIQMDVIDFLTKPVSLSELETALDRAWSRHVLVQTPVAELLPPRISAPALAETEESDALTARDDLSLEAMERDMIMEALRRSEDNRKKAAEMLGISERKLYYRLTQYRVR